MPSSGPVKEAFNQRLDAGSGLTRDENPASHFCVYFGAYDRRAGRVFVGHHKKSGLWLFNGGHIDRGETADQALLREMGEEWGLVVPLAQIGAPRLLTITEIDNPARQSCTRHYDIWYFVQVDVRTFSPSVSLLATEYHTIDWHTPNEARALITDPNTLRAIALMEADFAAAQT
jgi:8-oxo-dGTP pyrophosphatase MutT (NUDIX family)